ncbi:hypothetical protein BJV78DRAFT_1157513 [Lactifluus subvellereus]|nr:hypothetical protein BJV78DRAFT_1157513 [Lactifluus subvellereus]
MYMPDASASHGSTRGHGAVAVGDDSDELMVQGGNEEGSDMYPDPVYSTFGPGGEDFLQVYSERLEEVLAETGRETLATERQGNLKACYECNLKFTRESDAMRHMNTVHLKQEHECTICRKTFSRRDALQRHEKNKH